MDDPNEGGVVDKFVAVFGGGMDPNRKDEPDQTQVRGNHLFMVDMETGRAIYKRPVVGSAAADPAVVDIDQDGYADTVYFGTTAGFLYKVDISTIESLVDLGASGGFKITSSNWDPFPIFNTANRPIYHEPTIIFVTELGKYAVAIGTGDREDLWSRRLGESRDEGRFYMFVDRDFDASDSFLPLDETDLQQIALTDANTTADYLRQSPFGWYLLLNPGERLISEAFSLAGVTIFSSYEPLESISEDGAICQRYGNSKIYVVTSTASNTLLSNNERYFTIEGGFLSPPFAETSQTKNPTSGEGGPTADDADSEPGNHGLAQDPEIQFRQSWHVGMACRREPDQHPGQRLAKQDAKGGGADAKGREAQQKTGAELSRSNPECNQPGDQQPLPP